MPLVEFVQQRRLLRYALRRQLDTYFSTAFFQSRYI
jgi:hypothetical protein